MLGVNLALRGGDHKKLRRLGFNPQISISHDADRYKCLIKKADPLSKTIQGGHFEKFIKPKVVHVYPSDIDTKKCCVRLYEKYVSKLLKDGKKPDLYLYPKKKPTTEMWYDDHCIGIKPIRKVVVRLLKLAEIDIDNLTTRTHSLRSTSGTRMHNADIPEQVVKEVTGHNSKMLLDCTQGQVMK